MRIAASDTDRFLTTMFARQLGLISTHQVEAAGFSRRSLYERRSQGLLVPVFRNVFRSSHVTGDIRQRHLAAGLALPGAAISGRSAAILHGMPLPAYLLRSTETFVLDSTERRCGIDGIELRRTNYPLPITPMFGLSVLSPAATIVSLAAQLDSENLQRCLDHGLLQRWYTVKTVQAIINGRPAPATDGRANLVALLDVRLDDSAHRSKNEQRCGRWLTSAGLTKWRRNFDVGIDGENDPVEVDFAWPKIRLCCEASPSATHASVAKLERDAKRRRLLTRMKWRVVEATDRHLVSQDRFRPIVDELRALGAT
jgi:hypothetical protein